MGAFAVLPPLGVEVGDYVVVSIDLSIRRAEIAAGEEDLLVRYQQAE